MSSPLPALAMSPRFSQGAFPGLGREPAALPGTLAFHLRRSGHTARASRLLSVRRCGIVAGDPRALQGLDMDPPGCAGVHLGRFTPSRSVPF